MEWSVLDLPCSVELQLHLVKENALLKEIVDTLVQIIVILGRARLVSKLLSEVVLVIMGNLDLCIVTLVRKEFVVTERVEGPYNVVYMPVSTRVMEIILKIVRIQLRKVVLKFVRCPGKSASTAVQASATQK